VPFGRLTPRQRQIADLICLDGLSVVAVARRLGMPIATARSHVKSIAQRLANPHGLPAYRLIESYGQARRVAAAHRKTGSSPGVPRGDVLG
jgi:DNA-binding NarL/FixJ family response regulator